MQEENLTELYVEIDVLVNLEQYQLMVPDTSVCYLPYGTFIKFETIFVPVSHISGLSQTPHSLLKWESSTRSLLQVPGEVSFLVLFLLCMKIYLGMHSLFYSSPFSREGWWPTSLDVATGDVY